MQMMRLAGSCPSTQAGKATDVISDFIDRGGTLMMRRRTSPRATRESCQAV
jgi:hypothetical protein